SPLELAILMKTTSANISQQLRLLELGGLVKSEKTANSEKGKPRLLYSLSQGSAFRIMASPGSAEKKLLPLTPSRKFLLMVIMQIDEKKQQEVLEAFFRLQPSLGQITAITYGADTLTVVAPEKSHESLKKILSGTKTRLSLPEEFRKKRASEIILYNPLENGVE
ncbi:MAG: hypothetical protein HGA85_01585, partial [Nanoarchaeota archaeon]|nr:hypothetical protein [Nanoarchaeota archaeon]